MDGKFFTFIIIVFIVFVAVRIGVSSTQKQQCIKDGMAAKYSADDISKICRF